MLFHMALPELFPRRVRGCGRQWCDHDSVVSVSTKLSALEFGGSSGRGTQHCLGRCGTQGSLLPGCWHAGTSSARSLPSTCWRCSRVRESFNGGQLFLLLFALWQGQVSPTQDNFEAAFTVQRSPTLSESCVSFILPQCQTWKQFLISGSPFQSGLDIPRLLFTGAIFLPSSPSLSFLV